MTDSEIVEMLKELIEEIDYDLYKAAFVENCIEDQEENQAHVDRLMEIVKKHTKTPIADWNDEQLNFVEG